MSAVKKRPPIWLVVLLVLVFGPVAIVVVGALMKGGRGSAPAAAPAPGVAAAPTVPKTPSAHDHAMQAAGLEAVALKQSMKDPKAFELVSLVVSPSNAGCFTYRSTNGFGAHLQMEAVLTPAGKMVLREQSPGAFAAAWNKHCASGEGDDIAPYLAQNHVLD